MWQAERDGRAPPILLRTDDPFLLFFFGLSSAQKNLRVIDTRRRTFVTQFPGATPDPGAVCTRDNLHLTRMHTFLLLAGAVRARSIARPSLSRPASRSHHRNLEFFADMDAIEQAEKLL